MDGFGRLRELTEAHGPVGYEREPRELVRRELEESVDSVATDPMGNVIGTVEGGEESLVVAAHMDEIGFMVTGVDDEGFLRLDALGGWNPEVLRAARVRVHTGDGTDHVDGVIGAVPAHVRDADADQDVADVAVDVGLDAEAARNRVSTGDVVTMRAPTERLGDCVVGKALDDRAGVWAMLGAAARADPDATVHFVATVQEEVGLRGARGVATDIDPDVALALDGTLERSVPGVAPAERVTTLGDGVGIKAKDATVVPTPSVVRALRGLADDRGIPHQTEVANSIGTDTGGLQTAGGATPVGALSVPVRYHHSVVETAHLDDLAATVDLLVAAVEAGPNGLL